MTLQDIADMRLANMQMIATHYKTPQEIVSYMGAMQAQDYLSAKWAIGLRLSHLKDAAVDDALNEGMIIRTHILRPTWHFVAPQDIRWMQRLTSSRVHQFNAYYYRQVGLDDALRKKANAILIDSLKGNTYLTREELTEQFIAGGIPAEKNLLSGHIMLAAELDLLVCSGPRIGKQFTYALIDERIPKTKELRPDEALSELVLRYFTSHGPATIKDIVWWSGLTVLDIKRAIEILHHKLVSESVDGIVYYFSPQSPRINYRKPFVTLQPAYDEYTVAYKYHQAHFPDVFKREELGYGYFIVINGQISGIWKREIKKTTVQVSFRLFRKVTSEEDLELQKQADRFGKFLELPVKIV